MPEVHVCHHIYYNNNDLLVYTVEIYYLAEAADPGRKCYVTTQ